MPITETKTLGVVSPSGTPVIANGSAFTAITNHPLIANISHKVPGGLSQYNLKQLNNSVVTTSFTPMVTNTAYGPLTQVNWTHGSPSASDATSVHGDRLICPKAAGKRGLWIGQGQSLVITSSASTTVYLKVYRWSGKEWQPINSAPSQLAMTAATPVGLTNTGVGGFFALEMSCLAATTLNFDLENRTYAGGGFNNLPGYIATGPTPTTNYNQEVFTFKLPTKFGSFLGTFEEARMNAASLRGTCSASFESNGGSIDQVQLPLGKSVDDLLQAINQFGGDVVGALQGFPGKRYESAQKGSYAPMVPDGPKYWNYRDMVDVNEDGSCEDAWWELDKRISIVALGVSANVPTASIPANQFVMQSHYHVEAYADNEALAAGTSALEASVLEIAATRLRTVTLITENPNHVVEILGQIWNGVLDTSKQLGTGLLLMPGTGRVGLAAKALGGLAMLMQNMPRYTPGMFDKA
jgi:hypothetical protein